MGARRGTRGLEVDVIAFLGMGLLGGNFVRALRRRGEAVQVWSRTAAKAQALAEVGAIPCASPAEAVRGAARVHLTLSDDASVDAVLEAAAAGLSPGAPIVDHSTTSPAGAAARVARWHERGHPFQHAPVFMGPQHALESSGLMLASGDKARFGELAPVLEQMTGRLVWTGPDEGRAAALKLVGNLFLMCMSAGLVDALGLGKAMGVPPAEAGALFDLFNPGAFVPARVKRILAAEHDTPSWTLEMARKDARLMQEAAGGAGLALLPALAAVMDRRLAEGLGQKDWMVIGRDVTG